ncbi:hypothetical protein F5Y06DRAFT_114656 [Hypoxylon sp. FL0890]|nr:hypothetical protein F5Y06DRAFT_114656 [Hypoxylon sp. FL0890]
MSNPESEDPIDTFQGCTAFSELPDDDDPWADRKIFLHRTEPSEKPLSKRDIEIRKREEYLRSKWGGNEAMPASFDPNRLEAVFQARPKTLRENNNAVRVATEFLSEGEVPGFDTDIRSQGQGRGSNDLYREDVNTSQPLSMDPTAVEPQDLDKILEAYESEPIVHTASAAKTAHVTRTPDSDTNIARHSMSAPIERIPTPRIRAGSRPPLSRSAFSSAGLPSPRDGYPGDRPSATLRDYPRAPKYFPFESKVTKEE